MQIDYPDLMGFLAEREITYTNLYHGFEKYCENIGPPLNLCGISLGAILALDYAVKHHSRVGSLVLIAPQIRAPRLLLKIQTILFRLMPEKSFTDIGLGKVNMIKLSDSMLNLNFEKKLNYISCNSLILCGERDLVNKGAAKKLTNILSNSQLKIIKNSGHEINIETPEKLAHVLKGFYGRD